MCVLHLAGWCEHVLQEHPVLLPHLPETNEEDCCSASSHPQPGTERWMRKTVREREGKTERESKNHGKTQIKFFFSPIDSCCANMSWLAGGHKQMVELILKLVQKKRTQWDERIKKSSSQSSNDEKPDKNVVFLLVSCVNVRKSPQFLALMQLYFHIFGNIFREKGRVILYFSYM